MSALADAIKSLAGAPFSMPVQASLPQLSPVIDHDRIKLERELAEAKRKAQRAEENAARERELRQDEEWAKESERRKVAKLEAAVLERPSAAGDVPDGWHRPNGDSVNHSVKIFTGRKVTLQQALQAEKVPVATPSKEELARQWLSEHHDDVKQSSRWLSDNIEPQGVKISHVTWNKIKKEFG